MFFNIHVCVCIDYSTYKLVFISFATYTVNLSVKSFTFLTISGTRYFGFPLFQISYLKKRKFVLMYLVFALETTYSWKELERVPMLSRLAHQNTITYVVSSAPVNRSSPVGQILRTVSSLSSKSSILKPPCQFNIKHYITISNLLV